MATVSKDSLAQFWLQTISSISTEKNSLSSLLSFIPENEYEKTIFDCIDGSIHSNQRQSNPLPTTTTTIIPKSSLQRKRFIVNIDVFNDDQPTESPSIPLTRSLDQLTSLMNTPEHINDSLQSFVYPWLIDLSFQVTTDLYSILVDLMNTYPTSFFRYCFIPWIHQYRSGIDHHFFSNLFSHLHRRGDQNQLCIYLSEDVTCSWNPMEFMLISHWLEKKDFFYSPELFQFFAEKCLRTAEKYPDCLIFAKVFHKILIKFNEYQEIIISDEQKFALKQIIALNTTILSDILLDLLD